MKKKIAIALLCVCTFSSAADAATIGFAPTSQTVFSLGASVAVDLVISDLSGEVVSAYDLDVLYDASVLSASNVSFGPLLGDPAAFEVFEDFDLSGPGVVDLAQLSLLGDAQLLGLQGGDSITVATLYFDAVGAGQSLLDFRFDAFNDIKGSNGLILTPTVHPGSVSVATVPEPGAALVFLLGGLVLRARVRGGAST